MLNLQQARYIELFKALGKLCRERRLEPSVALAFAVTLDALKSIVAPLREASKPPKELASYVALYEKGAESSIPEDAHAALRKQHPRQAKKHDDFARHYVHSLQQFMEQTIPCPVLWPELTPEEAMALAPLYGVEYAPEPKARRKR